MAPGHVNPSYYNPNFLLRKSGVIESLLYELFGISVYLSILATIAAQIDEQTGPSSIIDVAGSAQLR